MAKISTKTICQITVFGSLAVILAGCNLLKNQNLNLNNSLNINSLNVNSLNQTVEREQQNQENKTQAVIKCQDLCQQESTNDGQGFDVGPCLSNAIAPDWVCDVAHKPRQTVDDDPAHQCSAVREGKAHHYVEVDGNCNIIKIN